MRIGFANFDWSDFRDGQGKPTYGGSGWYRLGMPAEWLKRNGMDVVVGKDIGMTAGTNELVLRDLDGELHGGLDVLVVGRWMDAHAAECIRLARAGGQVIIGDVDDWYDGLLPSNAAWKSSHPRQNPQSNRDHYRAMLGACTGLTCSTPFLVGQMEKINRNVRLVRNAIDLERWKTHKLDGPPIVGWVGAVPWRSGDLECAPIGSWIEANDVRFFHGGHIAHPNVPSAASLLGCTDNVRTSTMPMQSILRYPSLFSRFNIGIVPLRDVGFNEAKSAIKGIELSAAGIPFVASALPDYAFARANGLGTTAKRYKDWIREMNRLLDPDERVRLGARNRHNVAAFDIDIMWPAWKRAYEEISR